MYFRIGGFGRLSNPTNVIYAETRQRLRLTGILSEGRATVINQIELKMKHYVDKIDGGLARELEMYSGSRFHDLLVYATEGGKRIRPIILMMSAETVGYTHDHHLDAAVAVDLRPTDWMLHEDM